MARPVNNSIPFITPEMQNVLNSVGKFFTGTADDKTSKVALLAIAGTPTFIAGAVITFGGTVLTIAGGAALAALPGLLVTALGISLLLVAHDLFKMALNLQKENFVSDDAKGIRGQGKAGLNKVTNCVKEAWSGAGEALFGSGDLDKGMKKREFKTLTEGTFYRPLWNFALLEISLA